MKYAIILLTLLGLCLPASAQFRRSSDNGIYPYNTNLLLSSDVFIIGRPGVTNYNYAYSNLNRLNLTNVTIVNSNSYSTNIYTTNLYAGNIYTTNLFTTNLFATYTTNTYVTNLQAGDIYTTNLYTTNLFSSNIYTTNITANFTYTTNLFAGDTYTTNLYVTNLYSSNIFTTNITANFTYTTNLFAGDTYTTNLYVTNITVIGNVVGIATNEIFCYNLSNAVAAGATSLVLDRAPAFPLTPAGRLVIGYGTTNPEIRSVNNIVANAVSFNGALLSPHASGNFVIWVENGDVSLPAAKIYPASGIDSGWELVNLIEEVGNAGNWVTGGGQSPYTTLPIVAPNSTRIKGIQLNAKAGYPLGNTNVYMYMVRQGASYSFTASAATDVITVSGGWSPPASASNCMVAFYAMGTNVLPQPLSNGITYFVMTNSATAFTVKLRPFDTTRIDLTTSGTGVMRSEAGSMGKAYLTDVYLNGQGQPNLNAFYASLQQQSIIDTFRADNFGGTGIRLTGQQAIWNNTELISVGTGIDMRAGPTEANGAQFMYFTGLNIEIFTNAILLGGGNNFFKGVHLESGQSTTAPIIDGSLEANDLVLDGLTYGGSPVAPNTNTLFLMGSASVANSYDLSHIFMSSASFDSIQLILSDQYRGHRIYAYNSTNGPQKSVVRIVAPDIPDSALYSSMFGGETFLGQAGRFSTLGQQHQHEPFMVFKAGTNDTGNLLEMRRSDWTTNSGFNANADFFSRTNAGAGRVLHSDASGNAKWDLVNQTLTNTNPRVPDFALPVNYWVTNAAFLFLPASGVDTTGKKFQVTDVIVTNSTAAAVAVTFPGTIRVTGTAFLTNVTKFHFSTFAGFWTNCACEPIW